MIKFTPLTPTSIEILNLLLFLLGESSGNGPLTTAVHVIR